MLGLAITLLLGFFLRITGINWDQGMHLHPDERMLIMVAGRINFFTQLNPDFFNYGSLPIYLLAFLSQTSRALFPTQSSPYDSMLYLGRALSLFADFFVILVIHKLTWKFFKNTYVALLAPLLYALCFFPIQNSHFFIVDPFLNLFLLLTAYSLIRFFEQSSQMRLTLIALCFAASLTTKVTAIIFLPFIVGVIMIANWKKPMNVILNSGFFIIQTLLFSFIFMPFAFLDWTKFISDVTSQIKLASDPYVFPYTLQYVGTTPYVYYVKNIFLWGLGPVISMLSLVGGINLALEMRRAFVKKLSYSKYVSIIIFLSFYFFYFLMIGRSSVKFMRYMLPIYPLLTMLASYGLMKLGTVWKKGVIIIFVGAAFLWTLTFSSMFVKEHTRISASNWILKNIPTNSVIAVEHWDDRLPIYYSDRYRFEELQIYNQPDDVVKWETLRKQLVRSDYLVIASNRLSTPLPKLSDCKKFKACYPNTAKYYQKLLGGKSNFMLVKEFVVQPEFRLLNADFSFSDQSADESFTVYDHPKILIFKKR